MFELCHRATSQVTLVIVFVYAEGDCFETTEGCRHIYLVSWHIVNWRASSINNYRSDLILGSAWNKREWDRLLDRNLVFGNMQVKVNLYVQENDLIAIFDFLTFLTIFVTGQDFEIDSLGGLVNELDFVASFFNIRASFLRTQIGLRINMIQLDF